MSYATTYVFFYVTHQHLALNVCRRTHSHVQTYAQTCAHLVFNLCFVIFHDFFLGNFTSS